MESSNAIRDFFLTKTYVKSRSIRQLLAMISTGKQTYEHFIFVLFLEASYYPYSDFSDRTHGRKKSPGSNGYNGDFTGGQI